MLAPQSYDVIVLLPKDQFLEVTKRKAGMLQEIEERVKGTAMETVIQDYKYAL